MIRAATRLRALTAALAVMATCPGNDQRPARALVSVGQRQGWRHAANQSRLRRGWLRLAACL